MADYTTYSQAWLEDSASIKIILAIVTVYDVVAQAETTFYYSTSSYITQDGLASFNPIIGGQVSLQERITNDGSASLTFGDLELCNPNGELDPYLDDTKYIWKNRTCELYYGDPRFISTNLADLKTRFAVVFNGIINDIDSKDAFSINFKLRDKMERLNAPISETKLGTYGVWANKEQNKDTLIPVVFGEVFNFSPLLVDPSTLEYQVHTGSFEQVIEIRDNDVPIYTYNDSTVGAGIDLSTGKFKLTSPAFGQVTCSLQGDNRSIDIASASPTGSLQTNSYVNSIAHLVALIVTQYGKPSTRLTSADLDLANLKLFATTNPQPVGIVVLNKENCIQVCNNLAGSKGSQLVFSRAGKLQLIQYGTGITQAQDPSITITAITESDIYLKSLNVQDKLEIKTSIKVGYCKNYTVQDSADRAIPEDHKDSYNTEWLTYTAEDAAATALYKTTTEPTQEDTYLIRYDSSTPALQDPRIEAERRLSIYKQQKYVYKMSCLPKMLALKLGQQVTLTHSRYGLASGKVGQVVGLSPNWSTGKIEVEVLI